MRKEIIEQKIKKVIIRNDLNVSLKINLYFFEEIIEVFQYIIAKYERIVAITENISIKDHEENVGMK